MSNTIWVDEGGVRTASMTLANSVTGHLLAMLILSGSALARKDEERDLIVFFEWHDQYWRGRGNVDFCLNQMPWDLDIFAEQIAFLDRVIDGAMARIGWQKVAGWTPDASFYDALLDQFRTMLHRLSQLDLRPLTEEDWTPPGDPVLCPVHDVLTYDFHDGRSCLICHI